MNYISQNYISQNYPFINILNKRWYYRLIPKENTKGLFSEYPRDTLTKDLIVSVTYNKDKYNNNSNTKKKDRPLFARFKSYLEFAIYSKKLSRSKRYFYELILGEKSQKPHFDIDIEDDSVDGEKIKDQVIEAIILILAEKGVELDFNDILIYTSHGINKKGKYKQSYHIVINNYCHANNVEAKAFYQLVVDYVTEECKQYIDAGVYSPTQQFRIVGSTKIGTNRHKTLQKVWYYKGKEIVHKYPEEVEDPDHELVMQLEESIVGFVANCKFLPAFVPKVIKKSYEETDDITYDDAKAAMKLMLTKSKTLDSIHDPRFPYKFEEITGPVIVLKRLKPSFCRVCNRVHEHENPFLFIVGEERHVYFHCRRAPEDKKLYIGKLGTKMLENNTVKDSPERQIQRSWTGNILSRLQDIAESDDSSKKVKIPDTAITISESDRKGMLNMLLYNKL